MRLLSRWLHKADVWHFNRRYVSRAALIGLFCAFIPLPMQMVIAGIACIFVRANLPLSIVFVWITNPLTIAPIFYACYRLGAFILDIQAVDYSSQINWEWFQAQFHQIVEPLFLGSFIVGTFASALGYTVIDLLWRRHTVKRWHNRKKRSAKTSK
ncbi:Uncharacterised protein [BD1-7 clade bacterium]|nr:Uncharacterised protein [BD1-7 clade bacterium]CAA0094248.1 Uncharacterised protein [BD1-7 clade bacterium]